MKFDGLSAGYRRLLWVVIAINAGVFLIEAGGGLYTASQALLADALDFLGDTLTYSITLLVIGMPLRWRARAALFKGVTLAVLPTCATQQASAVESARLECEES
jgi:Co/Zn/Cd efflux system component